MANLTTTLAQMVLFGATVPKIGGGYCASYNIRTYKVAVDAGTVSYPCLLAVDPLERQAGYKPRTFLGGQPEQDFILEHHYLHCEIAGNADFTYLDPDLRTAQDLYFAALKADPFMMAGTSTPAYHKVATVTPQIMRYEWIDKQFYENVYRVASGIYL